MSIDLKYRSYIAKNVYHSHTSQQYKDDLAFFKSNAVIFEIILGGSYDHFVKFREL